MQSWVQVICDGGVLPTQDTQMVIGDYCTKEVRVLPGSHVKTYMHVWLCVWMYMYMCVYVQCCTFMLVCIRSGEDGKTEPYIVI